MWQLWFLLKWTKIHSPPRSQINWVTPTAKWIIYPLSNDQLIRNSWFLSPSFLCKVSSTETVSLRRTVKRQLSTKINAVSVRKHRKEFDFDDFKLFCRYIRKIWLRSSWDYESILCSVSDFWSGMAQKNPPKKTQKSPLKKTHQKWVFLGFFGFF